MNEHFFVSESGAPFVWSSYGRPHPRTTAILRTLTNRIARKRGTACASDVYRHLRASMSVEIWRRVARQVISCWRGNGGWWASDPGYDT